MSQSQSWWWLWKPFWLTVRSALPTLSQQISHLAWCSYSPALSPYPWESVSWMCSLLIATKISHYYSQPAFRWKTGSSFFSFFLQQMLHRYFPPVVLLSTASPVLPVCLAGQISLTSVHSCCNFETVQPNILCHSVIRPDKVVRVLSVVFTVLGRKDFIMCRESYKFVHSSQNSFYLLHFSLMLGSVFNCL